MDSFWIPRQRRAACRRASRNKRPSHREETPKERTAETNDQTREHPPRRGAGRVLDAVPMVTIMSMIPRPSASPQKPFQDHFPAETVGRRAVEAA